MISILPFPCGGVLEIGTRLVDNDNLDVGVKWLISTHMCSPMRLQEAKCFYRNIISMSLLLSPLKFI